MNFEEVYKKVQDGTATAEEKAYVDEKISMISSILDNPADNSVSYAEPEAAVIKKARNKFNLRLFIKVTVISLCVVGLIVGGTLWYVFGTAHSAAADQAQFTREQAVEMAEQYISEYLGIKDVDFIVHDIDRDYDFSGGLHHANFRYDIELIYDGVEYDISVNASSGTVVLTDID